MVRNLPGVGVSLEVEVVGALAGADMYVLEEVEGSPFRVRDQIHRPPFLFIRVVLGTRVITNSNPLGVKRLCCHPKLGKCTVRINGASDVAGLVIPCGDAPMMWP